MKLTRKQILTRGIIKENPVLILVLGLCPVLAVSTQAGNAIGMGLATTFVLLGSNIVISALRKIIPGRTRIPCYIVLIASFTVLAIMAIEAYAYTLYQALGIFLPLIAVNCIIFARAEMFASKNTVFDSILDALGSGVGFTLALFVIASIREIFGSGSWFGYAIPWLSENSVMIFSLAPGGFIVLACVLAAVNKLTKTYELRTHPGCNKCPNAGACGKHEHAS
ncbi:MAG: electron transport complex subunit E [Oscillospiraceae bacterium]|nr:electron transport complex subunit E [Oscillospiraceae bacterium]MCL2279562.1 electron transport complex subunit E [Oscillospiraceae bacterium]